MTIKISKLNSGITVITEVIPYLESVSIGVYVRSGSRDEAKEEHGIAHFLEHMLFKGTTRRTAKEITEEIENVGGYINAFTSIENTSYHARVLKGDILLAVDIIGDMFSQSILNSDDLTNEKKVVLEEIGASEDDPWSVVYDRLSEVMWSNQIIGRPILGTKESVQLFTSEKIRSYMLRNYTADRIFIVAVGAVDHDILARKVEQWFNVPTASKSLQNSTPAHYVGGEFRLKRELTEAHVLIGFSGCAYQSSDFYPSLVLAEILGGGMSSRLFQEAREQRSLCYSITAYHSDFSDSGVFHISTATGSRTLPELMSVIVKELHRSSESISQKELDRACTQIRARLIMKKEKPGIRVAEIARQMMFQGRLIHNNEIIEKLSTITRESISDLARRVFLDTKPTLSAIGPIEQLPSVSELEEELSSLKRA